MQRNLSFSVGEFYHIYNRGVDKRVIFLDSYDKDRFIKLLFMCNSEKPIIYRDIKDITLGKLDLGDPLVSIGAYCLMDNHFHLLVKEIQENGLSKFMNKLLTGYAMYFNIKYDRKGALYESTFKAKHLNADEYLKYIFAYVHLNPIGLIDKNWKENHITDSQKAKIFLNGYPYSSYFEFLGSGNNRDERLILNMADFPEYFNNKQDFGDFLDDWLNFSPIEPD